jgi:hypothetical protein
MGQSVGLTSGGHSGGIDQVVTLTLSAIGKPRKSTKGNSLAPPLGKLLLPRITLDT